MNSNSLEIYSEKYLTQYNNFIEQLKLIFVDESTHLTLQKLLEQTDEVKLLKGHLFTSLVNDNNLDFFLKNKIKVFSHKNPDTHELSESLFGHELCLKNLLNNQPEEVKEIIWTNLHILCLYAELSRVNSDSNKAKLLNDVIYKNSNNSSDHKQKLQEMLGVTVNEETSGMIDDIVQSFEKVLSGDNMNSNPLSGIMEVSQKISVKYADKINKGDIELDKLMEAISKKVPGMDEMMSSMLNTKKVKKQPKEKVVMDENFSTANVEVGINKDEESKQLNIGNMLKMVDQFGVLPGGKQSGDVPNLNCIPGLDKVMEMMQKLDKIETKEDGDKLKREMDEYLQKELGVDVVKLNEQLDTVTKQMQESFTPKQD